MRRMWWDVGGMLTNQDVSCVDGWVRRGVACLWDMQLCAPCTSVADVCSCAQDIITKLLTRDPAKRLGARAGAEEVKAHPFFCGINWALLRNTQPPFVPRADPTVPVPPPHAQAVFDEF